MAEDKAPAKKAAKPAAKKAVKKAAKPVAKTAVKKAAKPAAKAAVKKVATPAVEAPVKKEAVTEAAPVATQARATTKPAAGKISLTLIRSKHGRLASHKACVSGLGLRRMHQTVEVIDTPENRGMINKVHYLLNVEEA
jgi:large subunit ribosomal protein L30